MATATSATLCSGGRPAPDRGYWQTAQLAPLQASPSSHGPVVAAKKQAPSLQASAVQAFLSSQTFALPAHVALSQTSDSVQPSSSSQLLPAAKPLPSARQVNALPAA